MPTKPIVLAPICPAVVRVWLCLTAVARWLVPQGRRALALPTEQTNSSTPKLDHKYSICSTMGLLLLTQCRKSVADLTRGIQTPTEQPRTPQTERVMSDTRRTRPAPRPRPDKTSLRYTQPCDYMADAPHAIPTQNNRLARGWPDGDSPEADGFLSYWLPAKISGCTCLEYLAGYIRVRTRNTGCFPLGCHCGPGANSPL